MSPLEILDEHGKSIFEVDRGNLYFGQMPDGTAFAAKARKRGFKCVVEPDLDKVIYKPGDVIQIANRQHIRGT